jgi:predicted outer membrane repeat protein
MTQTENALARLAAAVAMLGVAGAVRGQSWNSYYVDSRAPAGGDGLSWATAFRDLQPALDHAMSEYGPPDIYIAGGTYHPDSGTGDRTRSYVAVTSGYSLNLIASCAGLGSADPFAVSIKEHPTIISGDLAGDDGPGFANTGDNSRTLLRLEGPGQDTYATISGVVFRGAVGIAGETASGALRTSEVENLDIDNCRFESNRGDNGAAIAAASSQISDCLFTGNAAFGSGGAIYAGYATIFNSEFRGNAAEADGGAAWIGLGMIERSQFLHNTAHRGGAVFVATGSVVGTNSVFARNAAISAGGAVFIGSPYFSYLYSVTLAQNSAAEGSCIWSAAQLRVRNCILFAATPQLAGPGPTSIAFSAVQGGIPGYGIISDPPRFVDAANDNYRLLPLSPCIDAGTNDSVWAYMDVEGNARCRDDSGAPDTGLGFSPVIDIGAYEFQGTTCYADCDASGGLNVLDFNCFLNSFGAGSPRANCDNSSTPPVLNVLDFTCFINRFTAGCP